MSQKPRPQEAPGQAVTSRATLGGWIHLLLSSVSDCWDTGVHFLDAWLCGCLFEPGKSINFLWPASKQQSSASGGNQIAKRSNQAINQKRQTCLRLPISLNCKPNQATSCKILARACLSRPDRARAHQTKPDCAPVVAFFLHWPSLFLNNACLFATLYSPWKLR